MIDSTIYYPLKKTFQEHQWENKKIIATVSGGSDSMALCYILSNLHVDFVIAHCNFHLRGTESNEDAEFVTNWAQQHNIPCYVKDFDIAKEMEYGGNLQEICRKARYNWFETLRQQINFHYIATAHHKNDVVETVLMNLMKGTGLAGLHGILPQNGNVIRPLLAIEKAELIQLLHQQDATWREDSSNEKDKYTRNKIRHHLLPQMQQIQAQSVDGIYKTSLRLLDLELLVRPLLQKLKTQLLEPRGRDIYISLLKLKKQEGYKTILYELLKDYGFSSAHMPDIIQLIDAQTGKYLVSETHQLIKNRAFFIVTKKETIHQDHVLIHSLQDNFPINSAVGMITITAVEELGIATPHTLFVAEDQLHFPLVWRPYKEGDYFYPIGMNMKKKKVSKLLKDLKIPIHEKSNIWVLESNAKIIWVQGIRMDERFKIKENTKQIIKITLNKTDY